MDIVTVVETPEFLRRARAILTEAERMELIDFVARHPMSGVAIGGGVRGGKSGGYRVIHFFSPDGGTPVFLITVFAKNEKANLTPTEAAAVKILGEALAANYGSKT